MRLLVIIFLLFAGCVQKKIYYTPTIKMQNCCVRNFVIGVKDVEVPDYLLQDQIIVKDSKKCFVDVSFLEDPRESLTDALMQFLQNYFKKAKVVNYPWQEDIKAQCIVFLQIKELFIKKDTLFIIAILQIDGKLYSFAISQHMKVLPKALDSAFEKLFIKIAKAVDKSCG